jgi:hypothetical protein
MCLDKHDTKIHKTNMRPNIKETNKAQTIPHTRNKEPSNLIQGTKGQQKTQQHRKQKTTTPTKRKSRTAIHRSNTTHKVNNLVQNST